MFKHDTLGYVSPNVSWFCNETIRDGDAISLSDTIVHEESLEYMSGDHFN